jgi:hypothetical protein
MPDFLSLLFRLALIVFAALEHYNETEEGHAALNDLLSDIEDEGFDIPGWEPDVDMNAEPLVVGAVSDLTDAAIQHLRDAWNAKHPQRQQEADEQPAGEGT